MVNELKNVTNIEELEEYLKYKAKNHKNFTFYAKKESVRKSIDNGIKLSNGVGWNDNDDKKRLSKDGKIRLVKSFTFSKSENVAMWMLYTGLDNAGGMIKYNQSAITSLLSKLFDIEIYSKNGSTFRLNASQFSIELIDIVYVGESKNNDPNIITLKRSDETVEFDLSIFKNIIKINDMPYYAKEYGWSYENECRLIISFYKELIENYDEKEEYYTILNVDNNKATVYRNPNCNDELNFSTYPVKTMNSSYKGKIYWQLCQNIKDCKSK